MEVKGFFDKDTFTVTYVAYDPNTKDAVIIDPVLDYDPKSSTVKTDSVRDVVEFIKGAGLQPQYVLETHAHADHLSGSQKLKNWFPDIRVAINENIVTVQAEFKKIFHLSDWFRPDGSQFDRMLKIGETLKVGSLNFKTLATPGHTPACSSFLAEKIVFTGDALFMPDYGTGRTDFPLGSAKDLYYSISNVLYSLPDDTKVLVGHDYMPGGRPPAWESSIGEQKKKNIHLNIETTEKDFVTFREERDKGLEAPRLLLPSVQVNINAGNLPPADDNGVSYLKIPVRVKE